MADEIKEGLDVDALKAELESVKADAAAYKEQLETKGKKAVSANKETFKVSGKEYKLSIPRVRVPKVEFGVDICTADELVKYSKDTKSNPEKAKAAKVLLAKWVESKVAFVVPV